MNKLISIFLFLIVSLITFAQEINPNGKNIFYYENGKISSEGNFKNGKPEGLWKTYFETGELKSIGNRKNSLLDSVWNFYNKEGVLLKAINYKNDVFEGVTKNYNTEGFLVKTENFIAGKKEGFTYTFFENGNIKSKTNYINNKKEGLAFEYNLEGTPVRISRYENDFIRTTDVINQVDKNGLKQGKYMEFYEGLDQVKWEGEYLNDLKNGYFREYSKKGILLSTTKYSLGEVVENAEELQNLEIRTTYYANGIISSLNSYRDGVLEGVSKNYDSSGAVNNAKIYRNGKLLSEGIIDDEGIKQGFWKEYFLETGKVKAEGEFKEGARFGEWKFYFETGEIEQTGKYTLGGLEQGKWKWYYKNGKLLREEDFRRGKEDGYLYEYDLEGNIITQGEYIDGYQEGNWIVNYGDYREEGKYSGGLKNGIWKQYYTNYEVLAFEGAYAVGTPEGKHTYYHQNGNRKLQGKYEGGVKDKIWTRYNPDGSVLVRIYYEDGKEVKLDGLTIKPKSE